MHPKNLQLLLSSNLTESVHELVDEVEHRHLERDPGLLLRLHADEEAVEAVRLSVHAVSTQLD